MKEAQKSKVLSSWGSYYGAAVVSIPAFPTNNQEDKLVVEKTKVP